MPKKEYEWEEGSIIEDHSLAKHDALREYLIRFVNALSPNPLQERLNLDVVDGFAGGGIYKTREGKDHLGSPLLILRSLEEAEVLCNEKRKNIQKVSRFQVTGNKYFIDNSPAAIQSLHKVLTYHEYQNRIGKDIHIINKSFEDALPVILNDLQKSRKKVIFLLDQYMDSKAIKGNLKTSQEPMEYNQQDLPESVTQCL